MNYLPEHTELSIDKLSAVFNNATNSYKFYWFWSILDSIEVSECEKINIDDLCIDMFNKVWYPLNYFKLSFGKQDGFKNIEQEINNLTKIDNSVGSQPVFSQLKNDISNNEYNRIKNLVKNKISRYVQYRFLRPFFKSELNGIKDQLINNKIEKLAFIQSQTHPSECLYYFENNEIVINKIWMDYLIKNNKILKNFCYYNLIDFLQKNNSNTIGLNNKIFKPSYRLIKKYKKSWQYFLSYYPDFKCIYSGVSINDNFALDHFIPWSVTAADESWNLIPTLREINSKKSNNLPDFEKYGESFTKSQFLYFKSLINESKIFKNILEEYSLIFKKPISHINEMTVEDFYLIFNSLNEPRIQIAKNQGFSSNWIYKE